MKNKMRVVVLASGSKGNVTFVEDKDTRILIDVGKSCDYIENKLKSIGVDPQTINAILITHTHVDHIGGIRTFYKKYKPLIYLMPKMLPTVETYLHDFDYRFYDATTEIKDFQVSIIRTSHDAPDSVGFIINDMLVYLTDTGYLNQKYFPQIENKAMYVMESNHDVQMLMDGKYPYYLKQRILGSKGHLSNHDASLYLSRLIGKKTSYIVLAHLSQENNTREKALEALLEAVDKDENLKIAVAEQDERTEVMEIC